MPNDYDWSLDAYRSWELAIDELYERMVEQLVADHRLDVGVDMTEDNAAPEMFEERLKKARELRGWSQAGLGEKAGMPGSSIAHFETGTRKPAFESLRRLANALEITTDYLLGRVDNPDPAQAGDPLFRDMGKLSGDDREIAKGFLEMLAKRNATKKDKDPYWKSRG